MSDGVKRGLYLLMLIAGLSTAILAVVYFGGDYAEENRKNATYSETLLQYDGWFAAHKDGTYSAVTLPTFKEAKGDSITIVNALPRELESGTYLVFESTSTRVTVSVDGEMIYENVDNAVKQPLSMWMSPWSTKRRRPRRNQRRPLVLSLSLMTWMPTFHGVPHWLQIPLTQAPVLS